MSSECLATISAFLNEKMSIAHAAREHNVHGKTLDDKIKNKVVHATYPGPSTMLTKVKEDAIMLYLIYMGERRLPLNHTLTEALTWVIAVMSGKHGCFNHEGPSEHRWNGFRR